jgi:hypothetical protein
MRRSLNQGMIAAICLFLAGCGGGASSTLPPPVTPVVTSVTVSPSMTSVAEGSTVTFSATVHGTAADKTVTWKAVSGSITPAGVYTAPASLGTDTVTATSHADPSKSGTASISVTAPTITAVAVSCTPTSVVSMAKSACQATVTGIGSFSNEVAWSVDVGTIDANGNYTAPAVTASTTATVKAVSNQDSTKSGTAAITVTPAPPPTIASVGVSCAPSTVAGGQSTQCTANVQGTGNFNTAVTWSVDVGSITTTGNYTAPTVTTQTSATVKAVSVEDTTKSGTTIVTVTVHSPADLGAGQTPTMVVDASGNIDVAWIQPTTGVVFRRSSDGGSTFAPAVTVGAGDPQYLQMRVDAAGDIDVLWWVAATIPGLFVDVLFSRSTNGGLTFSTPVDLSPAPGGVQSYSPQLVVQSAGGIGVAWSDLLTPGVFFIKSTNGTSFSSPVQFGTIASGHDAIDVVSVPGTQNQVYTFWTDEDGVTCNIFFARSLDSGSTFASARGVSQDPTACSVNPIPLVDSNGNINVAWHEGGSNLLFSRSTDQGSTFAAPTTVVSNEIEVSSQQLAVEPSTGAIDIVWSAAQQDLAVEFARSTDHGATFSGPLTLSLPPSMNPAVMTGAGDPAIGIDSCGGIHVSWEDDSQGGFSGDFDIYTSSSADGVTFTAPANLSNTPDQVEDSSLIGVDSAGKTYIIWETTGTGSLPNQGAPLDIYFFYAGVCSH